uniref:F-box/LRR-repeat protein 2 n=1 Tax=Sphaerodactylus townsendi TaxID=933632 RepID=A0ACB8FTU1_9SAUR
MAVSNDDEALINKKLPKELLLRIFSFLDIITLCRCAQVSKSWNILALDGSNWQRIDLFNFQTDVEVHKVHIPCIHYLLLNVTSKHAFW